MPPATTFNNYDTAHAVQFPSEAKQLAQPPNNTQKMPNAPGNLRSSLSGRTG